MEKEFELSSSPDRIRTSEKYMKALIELKAELRDLPGVNKWNPTNFARKHKLSNGFIAAAIEIGLVQKKKRGRKIRYNWDFDADIYPHHVEKIRQIINVKTNGKTAKRERADRTTGRSKIVAKRSGNRKRIDSAGIVGTSGTGTIQKDDIRREIEGSLFSRLCPECAETLHQIIDLLKK